MKTIIHFLSAVVRRAPWAVVAVAVVLTVVFGAFVPQQERAVGNEGFSPDSPEFLVQEVISDYFSDNSEEPVQVVVQAGPGGDVLTVAGLQEYLRVEAAIRESDAAPLLQGRPGGDVVGWMQPVVQGFQMRAQELGVPLETVVSGATDADVKEAFRQSLTALDEQGMGDLFRGLVGTTSDLSVPIAETGLMVVFLNVSELDDPDFTKLQAIEVDMAEHIEEATGNGISSRAFSFALLFSDADEFQGEIGRLFGMAFLIIIAILMFVYWIHPKGRLSRRAALRRAAAQMGLTMAVIIMSITWMNGIGVLLGPKYLGIIGNFSELLQILPILLIGLGVDYAIHLTARYREEIGTGSSVTRAAGRATSTVGVALVLATATTSVGFLTNIVNPVTALADFGILAAVGITSAFLLMLTFVPAVRMLLDRRSEAAGRLPVEAMGHSSERFLPTLMGRMAVFAERLPIATLLVAVVFGALGYWGLTRLDTTFSFTDFLPEDSPRLATFEIITDEFAGGFGEETEVIIEGDVATPELHNALVAATNNMADTPDVVNVGGRAAAESPVSVIAQLVIPPDQGGNPETFDPAFSQLAFGAGLQPDLTVAPGTDVDGLYREALTAAGDPMRRVIAEVDGTFRYVDVGVSTQAGEFRSLELAENLKDDFAPVKAIAGTTAIPTNQNIIASGVVEALNSSQASSLAFTLLAAMALLVATFWLESRRPALGVITIVPVALVVLWVFGIMSARGIPFNPVTAMIANLAIGIGVPYTIHITHRYLEDRVEHDSPEEAIRSTTTHTGGALAGSAFTTAAGFGILVTSSLKPFQQFGEVTFWAIVMALVGSVFVLPSMLVLWDRWHIRRGEAAVDAAVLHGLLETGVEAELDAEVPATAPPAAEVGAAMEPEAAAEPESVP